MGQIQWTISLVMFGLFAIALTSFMVGFANDNNSAISIADDPQLNTFTTQVTGNITAFNTGAEGTYSSIVNSTITSGDTITSGTPFAITPLNVVGVASNVLRIGYQKIFGTDSGFDIFIVTFLGLLIFITAMYLWKTWGGRNPE